MTSAPETCVTNWDGIAIRVTFVREWTDHNRERVGWLEVESIDPPGERLPISDTGYRAEVVPRSAIDRKGGPVAAAMRWLDDAALSPRWRQYDLVHRRQLNLF